MIEFKEYGDSVDRCFYFSYKGVKYVLRNPTGYDRAINRDFVNRSGEFLRDENHELVYDGKGNLIATKAMSINEGNFLLMADSVYEHETGAKVLTEVIKIWPPELTTDLITFILAPEATKDDLGNSSGG